MAVEVAMADDCAWGLTTQLGCWECDCKNVAEWSWDVSGVKV